MLSGVKIKFDPFNYLLWLIIGLIIKVIVIAFLYSNLGLFKSNNGYYFLFGGDAPMYLKTTFNIINHNIYALYGDPQNGFKLYTGRMPGYEVALVIFNSFLNPTLALYAVIITQILFSVISTYCLALIAKSVFKSNLVFYIAFFLYALNTYITVFDVSILTESLAISTFIISFYLIIKPHKNLSSNLLAGVLLCWSIFMRQYIAPFFFLFVLYIILHEYLANKGNFKNLAIATLSFTLPFLIADLVWITRNYVEKEKFIPLVDDLHAGYEYPQRFKSLMSFVQAWGGDLVHWNPKAEITPFINSGISHLNKSYNDINSLPDYIYTSQYNLDSLKLLQKHYRQLDLDVLPTAEKKELNSRVISSLTSYEQSFKDEKPLYYFFFARFRLLYKFVVHSGTYNISDKPLSEQNLIQKLFKGFYTFLYWCTLLGGLAGTVVMLKKGKNVEILLVIISAYYMLLLCPFVLRRIEYRYFVLSYAFLTLIFSYFIKKIISKYWTYFNKQDLQR